MIGCRDESRAYSVLRAVITVVSKQLAQFVLIKTTKTGAGMLQ